MFGLFKKPLPSQPPYESKRWFIRELFDKVRLRATPEERLEGYIDLWERVRDLEIEFGVDCLELELERDEIRDAFCECDDPGTLYDCGIAHGLIQDKINVITDSRYIELEPHLRARFLRIHILVELDGENVDPRELDLMHQHAFYEVEKRGLNEFQRRSVLETEFGISGWRSTREMNPHIIWD